MKRQNIEKSARKRKKTVKQEDKGAFDQLLDIITDSSNVKGVSDAGQRKPREQERVKKEEKVIFQVNCHEETEGIFEVH